MEKPSRNQILAASSCWVAVALNIVPGLGAGYITMSMEGLLVDWFGFSYMGVD